MILALIFTLNLGFSTAAQAGSCSALVHVICDYFYPQDNSTIEDDQAYGACSVAGNEGCNAREEELIITDFLAQAVEDSRAAGLDYSAIKRSRSQFIAIPAQQVDLDGDGSQEHFEAEFVIFDDGTATGHVHIGQGYFVKVELGTISNDGDSTLYGKLYHPKDINGPSMGDISLFISSQPTGDEVGDDTENKMSLKVIGGHASSNDNQIDDSDLFIWDIDGASVRYVVLKYLF